MLSPVFLLFLLGAITKAQNPVDSSALCRSELGLTSAVGTLTDCSIACSVGNVNMGDPLDAPDGTPCGGDGSCMSGTCVPPTSSSSQATSTTPTTTSAALAACKAEYTDTRSADDFACFYYCHRSNQLGIDGSVDKANGTSCTKENNSGTCQGGECVIAQDPGLALCKEKYDDVRSATEYSCFYYCNRRNTLGIDGSVDKANGISCTNNNVSGTCQEGTCVASGTTSSSTTFATSISTRSSAQSSTKTSSSAQPTPTYVGPLNQCRKVFPKTVSAKRNVCKLQCKLSGGKTGYPNVPNGVACNNNTGKCQAGKCVSN